MAFREKKIILQRFLLLAVFALLAYFLFSRPHVLKTVRDVNGVILWGVAALGFASLFAVSLILKTVLRSFRLDLSSGECLRISAYGAMGNYLASFGGGTFGKAIYLNKKYGLSYQLFVSQMSATCFIDLILTCMVGALTIMLADFHTVISLRPFLFGFVFVGLILFLAIYFSPGEFVSKIKFGLMKEVVEGWGLIKKDMALMKRVCLLVFINYILITAELIISYKAFSIDVSLTEALLIVAVSTFFNIVSLTPANLGVYEGGVAFGSQLLGIGFGEGLLAAGLSRVMSVIVTFTVGGALGWHLLRKEPSRGGSINRPG